MELHERDLVRLSRGAAARDALALIEQIIEKEQEKISLVAFAEISKGALTSEKALSLFYQKHAFHTLYLRLTQEANQGASAATRIAGAETT